MHKARRSLSSRACAQVCGSMQMPEPSAEVGFMDSQQTSVSLNGPFRFSIAEANLLIRI